MCDSVMIKNTNELKSLFLYELTFPLQKGLHVNHVCGKQMEQWNRRGKACAFLKANRIIC